MAFNVKYNIDLSSVFRRAYSDKDPRVKRKLRPLINDMDIKRSIAREAINLIFDRTTKKHVDKKNRPFTGYSKTYKESDNFKIFKGGTRKVNLKMTGAMLSSMIADFGGQSKITLTFTEDQGAKAHGHVKGTKVKKGKNIGKTHIPKRDFFGLPPEDEEKIVKKVINKASRVTFENIILDDIVSKGLVLNFEKETTQVAATVAIDNEIL